MIKLIFTALSAAVAIGLVHWWQQPWTDWSNLNRGAA